MKVSIEVQHPPGTPRADKQQLDSKLQSIEDLEAADQAPEGEHGDQARRMAVKAMTPLIGLIATGESIDPDSNIDPYIKLFCLALNSAVDDGALPESMRCETSDPATWDDGYLTQFAGKLSAINRSPDLKRSFVKALGAPAAAQPKEEAGEYGTSKPADAMSPAAMLAAAARR